MQTPIVVTAPLPPLSFPDTHANGFRASMPAAAPVDGDDVGAKEVEAGAIAWVVEVVIAAATGEEEVVADVGAAASVVPSGDVLVETSLAPAVRL